MSLFKRLFKPLLKLGETKSTEEQTEARKHMPEVKLPIDEEFTINFRKNGGKFLYCEDLDEIYEAFDNILLENDWYETNVYCLDSLLEGKFDGYNLKFTDKYDSATSFMLTTCESLVANIGGLLFSSNQLKDRKLKNIPEHLVVFATTSQLVENISEGMQHIKSRSRSNIPSNITTIQHFKEVKNEMDFMNYGSITKKVYLLLLEDL